MTCPRWRWSRLAFAVLAVGWVVLFEPALALPAALTLVFPLAAAADPARTRAWLDSHAFALAALLASTDHALLIVLGAATLPMAAIALFAPPMSLRTRTALVVLAAAALSLDLSLAPIAASLGAFFALRPLAALGEVLRALGLHRGPVDPLLTWHPLHPPHPPGGAP